MVMHVALEYAVPHLGMTSSLKYGGLGQVRSPAAGSRPDVFLLAGCGGPLHGPLLCAGRCSRCLRPGPAALTPPSPCRWWRRSSSTPPAPCWSAPPCTPPSTAPSPVARPSWAPSWRAPPPCCPCPPWWVTRSTWWMCTSPRSPARGATPWCSTCCSPPTSSPPAPAAPSTSTPGGERRAGGHSGRRRWVRDASARRWQAEAGRLAACHCHPPWPAAASDPPRPPPAARPRSSPSSPSSTRPWPTGWRRWACRRCRWGLAGAGCGAGAAEGRGCGEASRHACKGRHQPHRRRQSGS